MSFDLKIVDGDLKISSTGDLQKVENTDKLIQDIIKILTVPIGGNPFFPWYGSPISNSLVGNPLSFQFIGTLASSQLRGSLENLQKLQNAQVSTGQKVTPAELLAAIKEVSIQRNQIDPRYFRVVINALSKALTPVNTFFDASL
jgi:hypothetical protein